jgi:acyl carrier protein
MSLGADAIAGRVKHIIAGALDKPIADVQNHASLVDDLGAESIDFIDIVFRLEHAFHIEIPEHDIWSGSIAPNDPSGLQAAVARLKARMPEFRWDRLPEPIAAKDLSRLITVQTVIDYLERRRDEISDAVGS